LSYTQLTREQRYQIYALKKAGHNQTQIAAIIGVHKATVSRELARNCGQRGYRPKQAQALATERQHAAHRCRIPSATWALIESLLRQQWSPEQIAGRLKLEQRASVSHERIYQHIYADKGRGGTLHQHLRCRKVRRKRYGRYSRRGQIPNRIGIEARPKVVSAKRRIGDWEADTIIGKGRTAALVSLVERKSKLTLLGRVARHTAEEVAQVAVTLLAPVSARVHTITADNGREFVEHEEIAAQLAARFYFAHPYAAWERGVNENTNGLVRQYFPKGLALATITCGAVRRVQERLNNRPRKTLGYRTPNEVFFKERRVALTT
jgi:transposase, IS30 family